METYIERLNHSTSLAVMAFPLIACFSVGVLLLPWAAYRAGLVDRWAPIVATLAVLQHLVLPPEFPALEAVNIVGLALLTVVFGQIGVRTVLMSDRAWLGNGPTD